MSEKYRYIRLEPAKNGFSLSYDCVKENPMKAKGDFECCNISTSEQEVFQTSDSVSWDAALDQAAARMKVLYKENREMKEESSEY